MSYNATIHRLCTPIKAEPLDEPPILKQLPNIEAVLFDVYGTLFVTHSAPTGPESAMRETLKHSDFDITKDAESVCLTQFFDEHLKAHQDIRRSEGVAIPEVDIRDVWTDFLEEMEAFGYIKGAVTPAAVKRTALEYECHVNPVWPAPSSAEVLQMLKNAGITLGLVSNAQFYTPILIEALYKMPMNTLGFKEPFCIYSFQLGEAKPSPYLFKRCADSLKKEKNISPENILYVGNDIQKDIQPAQEVGLKTALYAGHKPALNRHKEDPTLSKIKPDLQITHFEQLAECLVGVS